MRSNQEDSQIGMSRSGAVALAVDISWPRKKLQQTVGSFVQIAWRVAKCNAVSHGVARRRISDARKRTAKARRTRRKTRRRKLAFLRVCLRVFAVALSES